MNNDFINNSNYYIPDDPPKRRPKKRFKPHAERQKAGLVFLSVILSFFLTLNLIVAILFSSLGGLLRIGTLEKIVTTAIDNIDIATLEISTERGTQTVSDLILDMAYKYKGFQGITEDDIDFDKLEDFAKLFITQTFHNSGFGADDITSLGWTPEQIYDFLESNQDVVRDLLESSGYKGDIPIEENKDALIATLESSLGEDGVTLGGIVESIGETNEEIPVYFNLLRAVFSVSSIVMIWCFALIIALILIPVNIKFPAAYLRSVGIPFTIAGALISVTVTLSKAFLPVITKPLANGLQILIKELFIGFCAQVQTISLCVLAIGILLTVASITVSIIKHRKTA